MNFAQRLVQKLIRTLFWIQVEIIYEDDEAPPIEELNELPSLTSEEFLLKYEEAERKRVAKILEAEVKYGDHQISSPSSSL
jgi:hypothetical protein